MSKFTLLDEPSLIISSGVFVNVRKLVMNLDQSCLLKTGVRAKVRANDVRLVFGWSSVVIISYLLAFINHFSTSTYKPGASLNKKEHLQFSERSYSTISAPVS